MIHLRHNNKLIIIYTILMRFLNILSAAKCVGVNRHLEENKSAIKIIRRQDKHKEVRDFSLFQIYFFLAKRSANNDQEKQIFNFCQVRLLN